ncbi:uncharacterized protein LOC111703803 [Eurytemora carolleeae]|uniref:uncharacterized protein LOC111703803 n=1 Tax=Eurytemora carolleeae TaxID=1294199 RepID=UPI000C758296|nr:uncharacterized protein LOC111703803 [Eurytemora carolleeae]|eukprot:XP_023331635.1 uncharacterized protein LOC111703803 [Eurytemora affinis]
MFFAPYDFDIENKIWKNHAGGEEMNKMKTVRKIKGVTACSMIKKIVKLAWFILCLVLLIKQIIYCVETYMSEPANTNIYIAKFSKETEPVFTVCSNILNKIGKPQEYNETVLINYGLTYEQYKGDNTQRPDLNATAETIYEAAVWKLEDIVQAFWFEDVYGNTISTRPSMGNWSSFWTSVNPNEYSGRCYTLDLANRKLDNGIKRLGLIGVTGSMYVLVHERGQTSDPELSSKVDVFKDYENTFTASIEIIKLRDRKLSPCTVGNYDQAIYKNVKEKMMKKVGCLVPYIPRNPEERICETRNRTREVGVIYSNELIKAGILTREIPPPCQQIKSLVVLKKYEIFSGGSAIFELQSTVRIIEQQEAFGIFDFFAATGGYIGLLLGYSALHITAIMDINCSSLKSMFSIE